MTDLMKTAVAYVRVSSAKQLDGDGPERQSERIRAYASANGLHVAQDFTEDVSGTKDTSERPIFAEMLSWCGEHGVQTILVEKMDRWARDLIVGELLLSQCRQMEITVIDCSTGLNLTEQSDDPYAKFVRQIMGAAAELNKNIFVHQTAKARRRKAERTGKCEGRKGYLDDPKFPQGPAVVARARELRRSLLTCDAIADVLQREGLPTKSGTAWTGKKVHSMLNRGA